MDDMQKIYKKFLEDDFEEASEEVKNGYSAFDDAFEQYLCAVQEDMFCKAFRYGYAQGVEAGKQDGRKMPEEDEETPGAATPRESR